MNKEDVLQAVLWSEMNVFVKWMFLWWPMFVSTKYVERRFGPGLKIRNAKIAHLVFIII